MAEGQAGGGRPVFRRTRLTWLAYGMLAYFAYLQAIPGPVMPFLRDELGLSYTVGAFHFSAFAIGTGLSGVVVDQVIARWGRQLTFWGGALGMASGGLVFVFGPSPWITIPGTGIMAFLGGFLITAVQSSLSDLHGDNRGIALTEANVAASFLAGMAPLAVGAFARIGLGWRAGMWVMALVGGAALILFRRVQIPNAQRSGGGDSREAGPLPGVFWAYWGILLVSVGVEWSVALWGAEFLTKAASLAKADASMVMSVFFIAAVLARWSASRLVRRHDPARLLVLSMAIGLVGFVPFWLSRAAWLSVIGLFVAGFGIANMFPLLLTMLTSLGPQQVDRVSGLMMMGIGVSMLVVPQTLGSLADAWGITRAYGLVGGLFMVALAGALVANRFVARHNRGDLPAGT